MSIAENERDGKLAGSSELCAESSDEALTRKIFGLALAIATEPSKLGQLRQMLVQLQEQSLKASQPGFLGTLTNE